VFEL
jgi:hypothetical protein